MKILLATDGSDNAAAALDFLLRFPLPEDSSVLLLSVIDERLFVDAETAELAGEQAEALQQARDSLHDEALRFLEAGARSVAGRGRAAETQLRSGDVAEEIILAAGECGADLVVVGSHGHSVVGRFLLGSVSTRVLAHAPCSVLIVKPAAAARALPGKAGVPWRVLLAYDDSAPARKALELCAGLPFAAGDEFELLTVLTLVTAFRQDIRQHMSPIWQQKKIAARAALDEAVARLRGSIPGARPILREGASSAHEVIEAAAAGDADLVVLGSKGKSAMQRFLLGSMTAHVARHAPCSVLVVR